MFLLGVGPRKEVPGWFWQMLDHALHADLREEMSADRLHRGDILRLSAGRPGILSGLGKCLITGDRAQAAQVVAGSRDPQVVVFVHQRALHQHHRHLHPFPHLHITYRLTNNTHFRSNPLSNLLTRVLQKDRSGASNHPFSQSEVERTAVEGMGLDRGILEVDME